MLLVKKIEILIFFVIVLRLLVKLLPCIYIALQILHLSVTEVMNFLASKSLLLCVNYSKRIK